MKLKALQEKEIKAASDLRLQKSSIVGDLEADADVSLSNAKKINEIILARSKEASLVITNLPPIQPD